MNRIGTWNRRQRGPFCAGGRIAAGLVLILCIGCESATEQGAGELGGSVTRQATRPELLLAEMPEDAAQSPTDVKDAGEASQSVVLAGRIDAGDLDPFQPAQVAFVVTQLPDEGHGEGDPNHADNCPFCKRKLKNAPKAIVQFRDADGNVLAGDARQVLGVRKGDVVYVTGTAQYDAAVDSVMVDASGVYRSPN
ncbi:hypothetical protein FYK55_03965 [Roseiconus nitratireducens]|uniref:Uncharacterized protein n=1 Tax=Roseiconus nitratireducens TaxID=2605748 RepID=A0A5M6DI71_9BACT|nr:hypothetical protein [Roseiconus nitratireducens]KAA5546066.1 hypothetical protein FYK55_03965 [Roseiconus nitratireducens]